IALLLVDCAGPRSRREKQEFTFQDQEMADWWLEGEAPQTSTLVPSYSPRPPWATKKFFSAASAKYVARNGWVALWNRENYHVLVDSLTRDLRERLVGDIETRVTTTIVDAIISEVGQKGGKVERYESHTTEVVSIHRSPEIPFNGRYDHTRIWIDPRQDTLWMYQHYDVEKYRREEQKRITREIRKQGKYAYDALEKSYNAYMYQTEGLSLALRYFGELGYYISQGGGLLDTTNLFQRRDTELVLEQRERLLEKIKQNVELKLVA
ncbi:unnamed protein product, partial [marine sediment metagenome]